MKKIILLIISSLSLFSCGLWKNYQPSKTIIAQDQLYRDTINRQRVLQDSVNMGTIPWQQIYTDSQLQSLIQKGLHQNADLKLAELTIRQAEDGLKVSRLAFLPSLTFSPQGTLTSWDFGKATQSYNIPLQANWQIDAFGTLHNTKKQNEATVSQTEAMRQAVKTSIISNIANLYYTLEMLDAQLKTTKETSIIWQKNVTAMEALLEAGRTNSAAVSQAKANHLAIQATIPTLEKSIQSTENALCLLLHEAPHAINRGQIDNAQLSPTISIGVPIQLLSNRPDVKAAEQQLASAFYGVQGARGAFYPQINLIGNGSWTNNLGMIINPGKVLASAIGSLVQPLFAKGKLRANLDIAKAKQEEAQLKFEKTLLKAGNEVSNALYANYAAQQKINIQKDLIKKLQENVENTQLIFQYDNKVSYLETLTAQQNLLQAQLNLISSQFDQIQSIISLYQALGGGRQ